jgi:hypothetical protein
MHELPDHIATAQILLDLSTEELSARLLFLIRERKRGAYWHLGAFKIEELENERRERPGRATPMKRIGMSCSRIVRPGPGWKRTA